LSTQIQMALNIRNQQTEKLASDLAALTGESKTEAVTKALQERLKQIRRRQSKRRISDRLDEIAEHCASLPILDKRSPDKMLYDKHGLPSS
jgi:antitoxin VapB